MYDLSTSNETQITTGGLVWGSPAIYGDSIVYSKAEDMYLYDDDIYVYNLSTSRETRITTSENASGFSIYGDRIIYSDLRDSRSLFIYNLSTSLETQIPTSENVWLPEIYSNRVVWYDTHFDDNFNIYFDIWMYDLSASQETRITTSGNAFYPAIYDNRIVWQNNTVSPEADIYMYEVSTSEETRITTSGNAYCPAIYDNRIVWADERTGSSDIYMATIGYPSVAAFCACPISGKAPLTVKFKDKSTGSPTFWSWNFGDKCTLTAQNPAHKYSKAGKYTVSLTVENAGGSDTKKICNYITVR
jgi:beta propeller repeat protein